MRADGQSEVYSFDRLDEFTSVAKAGNALSMAPGYDNLGRMTGIGRANGRNSTLG